MYADFIKVMHFFSQLLNTFKFKTTKLAFSIFDNILNNRYL